MDRRIYNILKALLANIDVLDGQLRGVLQSGRIDANEDSIRLLEHLRASCGSALQNVEALERSMQSSAFIIPKDTMDSLEKE